MFGFSILSEVFNSLIETKLVKNVYHSVVLNQLVEGGFRPEAPVSGRFRAVGVEDTDGFSCYCRQTGSLEVIRTEAIGGCGLKQYKTQVPHKLVFFNGNEERSQEEVTAQLMRAIIKHPKIVLVRTNTDPQSILTSESPSGRFNFTTKTYYVAIDFFVLLDIQADNCEQEIKCSDVPNPYCGPTE